MYKKMNPVRNQFPEKPTSSESDFCEASQFSMKLGPEMRKSGWNEICFIRFPRKLHQEKLSLGKKMDKPAPEENRLFKS